jgi:hypothetical protein
MQGNEDTLVWKKSSFSNGQGECVEVAVKHDGGRKVRDSKDPKGAILDFTPGEWVAFVQGAKAGEFDN